MSNIVLLARSRQSLMVGDPGQPARPRHRRLSHHDPPARWRQGFRDRGRPHLAGDTGGQGDAAHAVRQAGDTIVIEDRVEEAGGEIAAAELPAAKAAFAQAGNRLITLLAPTDEGIGTLAYYEAKRRSGAGRPIEANVARVIAARPRRSAAIAGVPAIVPPRPTGRERSRITAAPSRSSRASRCTWNARAFIVPRVRMRSSLPTSRPARKVDPEADDALSALADYQARHGELDAAVALVDFRLERAGSKDRPQWLMLKAGLQEEGGQRDAALATLDGAIAAKPGNAELLNARCRRRDQQCRARRRPARLHQGDRARRRADGLAHSRAMIDDRLGRFDEALADLDAALDAAPNLAASRYMKGRGAATGKTVQGDAELVRARMVAPQDRQGLRPLGY
ncbi:hypothetical protein AB5I41_29035 [Sphingomonas sp. MMS24-JH45]